MFVRVLYDSVLCVPCLHILTKFVCSLRTSETNYLNEAFSFYSAIRARGYYSKASKEDRSDLMVKKLRYYARFIVVCLLLKKMKLVRDLVRELAKHIDDYTATYEPDDQLEWNLVLSEIKSFIEVSFFKQHPSSLYSLQNTLLFTMHTISQLYVQSIARYTKTAFSTHTEYYVCGFIS